MFCRNCGQYLPPEAKFCDNCGTAVENSDPQQFDQTQRIFYNPAEPDQQPGYPTFTPASQPPQPKKGPLIPVLIGVIAVLAAAVIALVVYTCFPMFDSNGDNDRSSPPEESTVSIVLEDESSAAADISSLPDVPSEPDDIPAANRALSEEDLLSIMQAVSGQQLVQYAYLDMDGDQANELIGVFTDQDGLYSASWYCSSDGSVCEAVDQNAHGFHACDIDFIDLGGQTHIVLNAYLLMGADCEYSILALQNGKVECLVANQYGRADQLDSGDITLTVEDYDSMFDPLIGRSLGHTRKSTYLYFDGTRYREYGAKEISESEFLTYENAAVIKQEISTKMRTADTAKLEFSYYVRANGILHIQCDQYLSDESINYGYYTLRHSDHILDNTLGAYTPGQMAVSFSTLEVTF